MTPVVKSWLNKDAIDNFIERGSMTTYEKDLHLAGEDLLLKLVNERLLRDRDEGDDFIVNVKERMRDKLDMHNAINVYEFCMEDKNKREGLYVGKEFTLVRGWAASVSKEERERNISDGYKRVLRELHIWNKLRRSCNFVQLLHLSLDEGKSITAVLEKFDGDVRQSFSNREINFITIIKGIAKGLDFLHKFTEDIHIDGLKNDESAPYEKVTGIAHSDVKCANVLLRKNSSTPYLADFGVSHQVIEGTFTKMLDTSGLFALGTFHWMAPELLSVPAKSESKVSYTTQSDVWSFGMTIYEIVSRGNPWAQELTKGLPERDILIKIQDAMKNSDLPKWPATDDISQPLQSYSDSLRDLRDQCCKYDPGKRLSMGKVVEKLDVIFEQ